MPEGVSGYPRWEGALHEGPAVLTVAGEEVRRAWNNAWSRFVLILVFAYTIVFLGGLHTISQNAPVDVAHNMDNALFFLDLLRWGALALAAVMAGPSLLEDKRHGALELYLSRAVTRWDYLGGKVLAVVGLTTLAMAGPAILYWAASYAVFDAHPDGWAWWGLRAVAYALLWAVPVAGLGMGLSAMSRSSRAASLILFGAFATLDIIMSNLLTFLARNDERWQILSPFSAHSQQVGWLFHQDMPFDFPEWWGLALLIGLAVVGWSLTVWRRPRLKGGES